MKNHWKFRQALLNAFRFCPLLFSNVFLSRGGLVNISHRKFIRPKLRSAEFPSTKCILYSKQAYQTAFSASLCRFCTPNVPCHDLCEFRVRHVDGWTECQRPLSPSFLTLMLGHFPQNVHSFAQTKNSFINKKNPLFFFLLPPLFVLSFIYFCSHLFRYTPSLSPPLEIRFLSHYNSLAFFKKISLYLFYVTLLMEE